MISMLHINPLPKDEVYRRIGHISVGYKQFVIVWSGFKGSNSRSEYCNTQLLWRYNCCSELWTVYETTGAIPFKVSGSTGLVLDNYLYVFGGVQEISRGFPYTRSEYVNRLSRLDLVTLVWECLSPSGEEPLCCDKGAGWVHNDKLYFFGGYGPSRLAQGQQISRYQILTDHSNPRKGWNNRLLSYDTVENSWTSVITKGPPPSPRAAFSCDKILNKVFIFGGRLHDERLSDLHVFNLDTHSWSGNVLLNHEGPRPCGMSWHSLTAVTNDTLVLYGGINTAGNPNLEWWKLKVSDDKYSWSRRRIPRSSVWHTAVFSKDTNEIIIVGGISCSPFTMDLTDHCVTQVILQVAPRSLFRECLLKIVSISEIQEESEKDKMKDYIKTLPAILQDIIDKRILQGPEKKLIVNI